MAAPGDAAAETQEKPRFRAPISCTRFPTDFRIVCPASFGRDKSQRNFNYIGVRILFGVARQCTPEHAESGPAVRLFALSFCVPITGAHSKGWIPHEQAIGVDHAHVRAPRWLWTDVENLSMSGRRLAAEVIRRRRPVPGWPRCGAAWRSNDCQVGLR
jgi:hypothetical protein